MKVIIVGGSIAGLTLAHSLTLANIDFEVLDAYPIAPPVGASIAVFQNGAIVLDQLGIYRDLRQLVDPMSNVNLSLSSGTAFKSGLDGALLQQRFGYTACLLTRQRLIQLLYDKLSDKNKVHAGKGSRVIRVEQSDDGVEVFAEDGSSYKGDIVAGCDGIHSIVRSEMWRYKHAAEPRTEEEDKSTFKSEYSCLFGISDPAGGLPGGESNVVYGKPSSFLTFIGLNGEVYFFLYQKMNEVYTWPNSPKFSAKDAEELANANLDAKITETVTFGDIWKNRKTATLLPMDEGVCKDWHFGRFVVVGDAAHKMTVNMGQCGNGAIEEAGTLASSLKKLLVLEEEKGSQLTSTNISQALARYQEVQKPRLLEVAHHARALTRMQGLDSLQAYIAIASMMIQNTSIGDAYTQILAKANFIDYLPAPVHFNKSKALGSVSNGLLDAVKSGVSLLGVAFIVRHFLLYHW